MRRLPTLLVAAALVAAGCTSSSEPTTTLTPTTGAITTTSSATTTTTAPVTTTTSGPVVIPAGIGSFGATLVEIPLITDGAYGGPARWPTSLDGVAGLDIVPEELRSELLARGFVVHPIDQDYGQWGVEALSWSTQWGALYDQLSPYGDDAIFVTTDVAYHLWHAVFDLVLRETEQGALLPVLESMVAALVTSARAQADSLASDPVAGDAALRAAEHLEAVATVLELDVGAIGDRATAEVALVEQATEIAVSPTVGGSCENAPPTASCVDYSLTKPRGHYTRTPELERFFRAMSMLGNTGFSVSDTATLRVGLLISRLIASDQAVTDAWSTIYGPTSFLVGTADDYTPFEAVAVAEAVLPGGLADPGQLDDAAVSEIGTGLFALRDVQIDPQRASLRTMGARFVVDSWIYDQLTDPGVAGRVRPTPLDLVSVMGGSVATGIQEDAGVPDDFPEYADGVAELASVIAERTIEDWGSTVYDAWLYALEAVWADRYDPAFPPFMRDEAWDAKALNTGLASYTELKHDTILYAKQGIAEGEFPEPPPPPRHWVEPDPVAFARIAAAARLMRDGLIDAGLMVDGDIDVFNTDPYSVSSDHLTRWVTEFLLDVVDRLERIAREELAGAPISAEDNGWLSTFGSTVMWFTEGLGKGEREPTPLVADVFLDPFADEVLELGTGPQDMIHVIVPNDVGGFAVATGSVSTYYEFWGPRDSRMTDEEWWDVIIAGDLPDRPTWWTDVFD